MIVGHRRVVFVIYDSDIEIGIFAEEHAGSSICLQYERELLDAIQDEGIETKLTDIYNPYANRQAKSN
jgi:hypothetical protein